jgi:alkylation response protein AidB-like acyl-CoA dehydrogenase
MDFQQKIFLKFKKATMRNNASQITISTSERLRNFAVNCIANYPEFHEQTQFPNKLWEQMIQQRLFGIGIDTKYHGLGGTSRSLADAGMAPVEHGGNIGVAMSWLIHEMVARWLINSFGTETQKEIILQQLTTGKETA